MVLLKHLKVVVASPNDVQRERDSLEEIIKKVNNNYAQDWGLHLDVVRWEKILMLVSILMALKA
jgi:hypothetical protein